MGYHGYEIWFCSNGHTHTFDVWNAMIIKDWKCPVCEKPLYAASSIDETNGGYDPDAGWYNLDDYLLRETSEVCPECGVLKECTKIYDIVRILKDGNAQLSAPVRNPLDDDETYWIDTK